MPSEKILQQKQEQVAKLTEAFKAANVGVLVNYSGITVEKDTKLRKQLREAGCEYKVVKNTLLARAFAEAGIEGLEEQLNGTTAIAYSSKLPSKEVLLAQVLGGLNGPIQGFANVLSGTIRGLVIALNAIAEKQSA